MEKRQRQSEIHLPEAIIQRIQSFLSGKEAARTAVLSESWYSAWLTRPNLYFNQSEFKMDIRNLGNEDRFWELTQKTIHRYEELKLKIESFTLSMDNIKCDDEGYRGYSRANELIVKAMKMGATDLEFELSLRTCLVVLPLEVLGSENLVRLSVTGCKIDLGADPKVSCSRLKSLSFVCVNLVGDVIWHIISSCPLIEKLSLSRCQFLILPSRPIIGSSHGNYILNLSPYIEFGKQNVLSLRDGPIHLFEFHNLKSLSLCDVIMHVYFLRDFDSKFPCLKDLSIDTCRGLRDNKIHIVSASLESISFKNMAVFNATFDVPNIRKLNIYGYGLPHLTFRTASREWESEIFVACDRPSTKWFLKLKKLLASLTRSKIYLSFEIGYIVQTQVDLQSIPKTVVENLTMHAPTSTCSTLLNYVFCCCRPKFITLDWLPKSCIIAKKNNSIINFLCKEILKGVSENCSTANPNMFFLHDLVEASLEFFEESIAEWRLLPLKTLLDSPKGPTSTQKIRFHFTWRD